jgi:hypothetical protein
MTKRKRRTNSIVFPFLWVLALLLYQCEAPKNKALKVPSQELISSADVLLTHWHVAAAEANYDAYFGAMDSISIFIGTDFTENWSKKEFEDFSKPYFDKGKAWSFSAIDRNIYHNEDGSFIWFDELLQTWMGICRGSGVIENKDGTLKLKHYVLSVTVPNDQVSGFLKLKEQELDSTYIQSLSFKK